MNCELVSIWDLTGTNTHALSVGVGTSKVPYIFFWADVRREPDGYEFIRDGYGYEFTLRGNGVQL